MFPKLGIFAVLLLSSNLVCIGFGLPTNGTVQFFPENDLEVLSKTQRIGIDLIWSAIEKLWGALEGLRNELAAQRHDESVRVTAWMHPNNPTLNGCGFYYTVTGVRNTHKEVWFPDIKGVGCIGGYYYMRFTPMGSTHKTLVHLGNEYARSVELHADAYWSTYTNQVCFGFNEATIIGGPKSGCVNMDLLKGCQQLVGHDRYPVNLWSGDIIFTRASADGGVHKLVIENVQQFVTNTEIVKQKHDDQNAMRNLCNSIRLVAGSGGSTGCPARKEQCNWVGACNCQSCTTIAVADKSPNDC